MDLKLSPVFFLLTSKQLSFCPTILLFYEAEFETDDMDLADLFSVVL